MRKESLMNVLGVLLSALLLLTVVIPAFSVAVAASTQYSAADLVGTWRLSALASGPSEPWWNTAVFTAGTGGAASGTSQKRNEPAEPLSFTWTVAADGQIKISVSSSSTKCYLGAGKTVFVCTETFRDGSTNLIIGTKVGDTYSTDDLPGVWGVNSIASGSGAPWWEMGSVAVDSAGAFSGTLSYNNGTSSIKSGNLSIDAAGVITIEGSSTAQCRMDAGKTIIVCTDTWSASNPNTAEMKILTKKSPPYVQPDVAGRWVFNSLASGGPSGGYWYRGVLTIDASGLASGTLIDNDGEKETFQKSLIISTDGFFDNVAVNGGGCSMDARRMFIVCTISETTGNGTVEMPIFLNTTPSSTVSSLRPNKGSIGDQVTITGKYFGQEQGSSTVTFNGVSAFVSSWSSTKIVCTVPSGATTGPVNVTTSVGSGTGKTFTMPSPAVSSLRPNKGSIGDQVTVTGKYFGQEQGSSTVTFNGVSAFVSSWSSTKIVCTVPSGATTGPVNVTTSVGSGTGKTFTVK